ncbi:MAG: phosphohydrolase [Desulfurococcaceae archaeon]|nr:hypothetical protein [Sulfolobales archaeon]MDW8170391.1 phosphohydrolase [Desulfurococcaceae archaeon]
MVVVNQELVKAFIKEYPWLNTAYVSLTSDIEVRELWDMSNVMVVKRMMYNDHGPVHAHIVAGAALALYKILLDKGFTPTLIRDGVVKDLEYTWLVPLYGALLHDIGNSIHRSIHEKIGALLAKPIVERALKKIVGDSITRIRLRQEVLHSIFCTAYDVECLTIEAGVVKVGDGLDVAEGRARIPYRMGQINIHSVSALSIRMVEITEGAKAPVKVSIYMNELAGVFQVDEVLMPKLKTTPLKDLVEISVIAGEKELKTYYPH